jgi:multicomponent Na+:H+ antiporter subunit B
MLVASLWVLLRGHNEPGGGFIGGMIAVAALSLLAISEGSAAALRRIPLGPARCSAAGALLSLCSGLPALLLGKPYLTHLWSDVPLGFTTLSISTVQLFDFGVFVVVASALGAVCCHAIGINESVAPHSPASAVPVATSRTKGEMS